MKKALLTAVLFFLAGAFFFVSGCAGNKSGKSEQGVVKIYQANPPDMAKKLAAGEIDAFVAWEPFNAQAVVSGQGRYLVQSADLWPEHPCCVLAAAEKVNDPSLLEAMVWSHLKATEFINNPANREAVVKYAQEFTGQDRAVVVEALSHIKYVDYPDPEQFRNYYLDLKESGILKRSLADLHYQDEDRFLKDFLFRDVYARVRTNLESNPGWKPAPVKGEGKVILGYLSRDLHELAVYVAQKEGYYSAVGLQPGKNLEIREFANGVAAMEAFKAKELDFSYLGGAPATMKRINDDIRIRVIAGANNVGSAIVVRNDSPMKSVNDLAGKNVAVPAVGTVQYFVLEMALKKAGLQAVLQ